MSTQHLVEALYHFQREGVLGELLIQTLRTTIISCLPVPDTSGERLKLENNNQNMNMISIQSNSASQYYRPNLFSSAMTRSAFKMYFKIDEELPGKHHLYVSLSLSISVASTYYVFSLHGMPWPTSVALLHTPPPSCSSW